MTLGSNKMIFNIPKLQDLILGDCLLQSGDIRSSMFRGISFLDGLTIFKLNVSSVKPNAFRQMNGMRSILLKDVTMLSLESNSFNGLGLIVYLNLNSIGLCNIANCAFCDMESVTYLNLSQNSVSILPAHVFAGIPNISVIDLQHNPIKHIEAMAVHTPGLDVYFTLSYYCCFTHKKRKCIAINQASLMIDMCTNILGNVYVLIMCIIIATCVCLVNIAAIIFQRATTVTRTHHILTQRKFICNILLTLYCFVLFAVSFLYGENYILYETNWLHRNSLCNLLRLYVTVVYFMGVSIALLKAVNQLIATKYALNCQPLTVKQCNTFIIIAILLMILGGSLIFFWDNTSVRDIYCFPLEVTYPGWKLVFYVIYFSLMFLMIVAITIIYGFITRHVVQSSKNVTSTANLKENYRKLLRNISETVFHEFVTLLLYFIAAICNSVDGIDVRLRLTIILSAVFIVSSLHPFNYITQVLLKCLNWCTRIVIL